MKPLLTVFGDVTTAGILNQTEVSLFHVPLRVRNCLGVLATWTVLLLTLSPFTSFGENSPKEDPVGKLKGEVIHTYARIASAAYSDSLGAAETLQVRIREFLDQPSAMRLAAAREAWIIARKPYLQSEVFRFSEGPIDQIENRINAWPVDENYIDYVEGNPNAGIINNPKQFPELSRDLIVSLNEKEGEKNISTGFHAIEFLLWGQDRRADGPGDRSYRDYVENADGSAPHAQRRKEYLQLVVDLLVDDLRTLAKAWADGDTANYRAWFCASAPHQALGKILHGMGALGSIELAGERLTVPYETKDQEDEHSCFSDTTHLDARYDALGIQNVYLGQYVRSDGTHIEGPGIHRLLLEVDPALAREMEPLIQAGVDATESIPAPFDQAIRGKNTAPGRLAIHKAIQALQAQADPLARAFQLLGVRSHATAGAE